MKAIGDRIKANYENRARHELTRRTPVVVRIDGRAFHTFTRGMERPFDQKLIDAMVTAATAVAAEMQGFKAAFIQSDEVSLFMTDYDTLQTDGWFGYCKSKIETISASVMTAAFNRKIALDRDAHFDARAFNLPREEVANYFLWRALDWERNSVAMYCNAHFSHKQMHGQSKSDQHEMLHSIGRNWATDLTSQQRNGTWVLGAGEVRTDILPKYETINAVLEPMVQCDVCPTLAYRYRWVYSEAIGDWHSIDLPSDWDEERVREQMEYIEQSEGPQHGCRWSGFQFERAT